VDGVNADENTRRPEISAITEKAQEPSGEDPVDSGSLLFLAFKMAFPASLGIPKTPLIPARALLMSTCSLKRRRRRCL